MLNKPVNNKTGEMQFGMDFFVKALQYVFLGGIALTVVLSPVVIYYFTTYFESKLPMCTASQPASDTWRCQTAQVGNPAGGNPAYCPEGKQHFIKRGWCNINWDRPVIPAE